MRRFAMFGGGVLTVLVSLATPLLAQNGRAVPVPEIDGGSISTGLGLHAGGLLMLRARWRSR